MSRADAPEVVDCSGGPCVVLAPGKLSPAGRLQKVTFWRWQDVPRAHGGESYTLDVPLWEWDGQDS